MDNNLQNDKFIKMTTQPVNRLVCMMAVPSILSMLVTAFYNMADTLFVGQISTQATGAIGIVFSYMALVQAISFFFGHGSGNYMSRELGKKNIKNAEIMSATGFFLAIFTGVFIGIIGTVFIDPILVFFGATDTILPEARRYFRYILMATPFIMGSFVINNQMRMQGNARLAVIGIASGAILNLILDPIFIFVFKLGVMGASIATAISQFVGFNALILLSHKGDGIIIRWKNFHFTWRRFYEIFAGGVPSLARQGLSSVATICLNNIAKPYGDSAIAAFSVVNRVTMIAGAILIGFGQGFQPVCGFNYGAKLLKRVRKAFWFCVKATTIGMAVIGVIMFIFAPQIITVFRRSDPELIRIGTLTLRYECITMPLMGMITIANMFFQNIRDTWRATFLAVARQGLVYIPVLYIMSTVFKLKGLELAQTISNVITFSLTIPLTMTALIKLKEQKTGGD